MRALWLSLALGCAVTQQKHLPDPCDTTKKYVLVDSILTVVAVGIGVGVAALGSSTSNSQELEAGGAALGLFWGGAHFVSAVIGNNWATTCRELPQNSGERGIPIAR